MKKLTALLMAVLFLASVLPSAYSETGYSVPGNDPVPQNITVDTSGKPGEVAVGLEVKPGSSGESVTIPGDIEVQDDDTKSDPSATGVIVSGGAAAVDVDGNIDASSEGDNSEAAGVKVCSQDAAVDVGGNIDVTVSGDNSRGQGVEIDSSGNTKTTVGNIDVKADSGEATGVSASLCTPGNSVKVTVNGDIHTEGTGATGIYTHLHENTAETINVKGNITSEGSEYADGVNIHMEADTRADVRMNGDIHSTSPDGYASGVEVYANFDRAEADAVFTGDITADGGFNAMGIQLDSEGDGTQNTFTLNGNLTVSAESDVRAVQVQTDRGQLDLTVNGDITAVGEAPQNPEDGATVSGIRVYSYDEPDQMTVSLHGDLTAEGTEDHRVTGISLFNEAGNVTIDVEGNITSTGTAIAFEANSPYWDLLENVQVSVNPAEYVSDADQDLEDAYYYYKEFYDLPDLGGKPVNDVYHMYYNPAEHLYYMAEVGSNQSVITWRETLPKGKGKIDLTVHQGSGTDALVHGDEYGLLLENNNEELEGEVLIDGVLSGDQAGVCVNETAVSDQMTVTVWKIETKDDHPIVAKKDDNGTLSENRDFAEKIQYIIRTEQPSQGGSFTLDGTQRYKNYDVAHMNDKVTLKIQVESGYEIVGAYNGTDIPVSLQKDANGNYYLTVPNGGGVTLSITLRKITAPATASAGQTPAAAPAPRLTVMVATPPEWIDDTTLQADESGLYSLSEALSVQPGTTVEITNLTQAMPADIASALASRSIDEQISILLALFGAEGTEGLSADAQEALQSAKVWFDSLTPAEKEAFLGRFMATVEYEGSQTDGYVIVLSIREADGHTTLKRLSFVKKDGEFLLVKVEVKAS